MTAPYPNRPYSALLNGKHISFREPHLYTPPTTIPSMSREIVVPLFSLKRYSGQVNWSVGEHLVACALYAKHLGAEPAEIFACLMHDVPEIFTGDINGPFQDTFSAGTRIMIKRFNEQMLCMFGVEPSALSMASSIDRIITYQELELFLHHKLEYTPFCDLHFLSHNFLECTYWVFMELWKELSPNALV